MGDEAHARSMMRSNIDAWWPHVENGIEAIVSTASGCGLMVKEYARALEDDVEYTMKAARISALARDIGEILREEDLGIFSGCGQGKSVAYQSSCTLQHGQKLGGMIEPLLERCGYTLVPVADGHLCCGAAGAYSLQQPELSGQLRENKLRALEAGKPDVIATSNIGCQMHLEIAAKRPVKHWIELLDQQ
jgi:glycolate oxidase iron-sulfur subunit